MWSIIRTVIRLLMVLIWISLGYFALTTSKLNWIALIVISMILFLFYLATYVTPVKTDKPTNLLADIQESFDAENNFQHDGRGRIIAYPYGLFGNGYVLPDEVIKERIKNFFGLFSFIGSTAISFSIIFSNPIIDLGVWLFIAILMIWYRIVVSKLVYGLEVVRIGAEDYSPPTIDKRYRGLALTLLLGGLIGGVGDIYNHGVSPNDVFLVAATVIFLGAFGYVRYLRG